MSEARTGPLVAALADGLRADLDDIATAMEAAREKVEGLRDAAMAINGLGGECAGWSNHLASLIAEVRKEQAEVPAKLLGQRIPEITQNVDTALIERVRTERKSA